MAFAQAHKSRPLSVNTGKNVGGLSPSPTPSPSQPESAKATHSRTKSASPATSSSATSTRRQSNGSARQSHDGGGKYFLSAHVFQSVHYFSEVLVTHFL